MASASVAADVPRTPPVGGEGASGLPSWCGRLLRNLYCNEKSLTAVTLQRVVRAVATRYVVVCRGPNCRERGGLQLRKRLSQLFKSQESAQLVGYNCFGQCDFGPNVLFYPEGEFYGDLRGTDAAERVVAHACREQSLGPPLSLPEEERRLHLANVAELLATLERDRSRGRRWWWPF